MTESERELDLMVAELERENRLMKAQNERLERELAIAVADRDEFKKAVERVISVSQLAFRNSARSEERRVGKECRL